MVGPKGQQEVREERRSEGPARLHLDGALDHLAPRHLADRADLEDLLHVELTDERAQLLGWRWADERRHHRAHVVERVVDNLILTDLDAHLEGLRLGAGLGLG